MITFGTIFVIFLLLYGMIKNKNYLMFIFKALIVFSVYINIGYFFKVGSFELAYSEILIFFFVLTGLLLIRHIKLSIPSILIVLSFLLTIIIGYWFLISNPSPPMVLPVGGSWDNLTFGFESMSIANFNSSHVKRFVRIILFIAVYFIVDRSIIQNNERTTAIKKFVVKMATISAWIGIIEQVSILIFSYDIVVKTASFVLGVGSSQLISMKVRGGAPTLQGFMLEPGHYAQSFLPAILILFLDSTFTETQRFRKFVLFSYVLFFSGSFAGFAILLTMIVLYVWSHRKNIVKKLWVGISLATLSMVFIKLLNSSMFDYYLLRVNALLYNASDGTSEGVRMFSIRSSLKLFYENTIFGIGLGTTDAHGFLPSILSNIGILGTTLWFIFMLRGFVRMKVGYIKWLVMLIPVLFFIGDTGTIYSVNMILVFCFVFRQKLTKEENIKIPIKNNLLQY